MLSHIDLKIPSFYRKVSDRYRIELLKIGTLGHMPFESLVGSVTEIAIEFSVLNDN